MQPAPMFRHPTCGPDTIRLTSGAFDDACRAFATAWRDLTGRLDGRRDRRRDDTRVRFHRFTEKDLRQRLGAPRIGQKTFVLGLRRGVGRYAEPMGGVVGAVGQLMRRIAIVTLVCVCLCLFPDAASPALATQAKVEGVAIDLPTPAGFCELSSGHPTDQRMLDTIGEALAKARGNQLLAMSADCRQLAEWRDGRRLLGDYGQYQAPRVASANDETFRQTCAALRSQGGHGFAYLKNDAKTKMEDSVRQMKVNEQRFVGFLGEEATACYVALLQKLKAEEGPDVTQLTVLAITMVRGKFLFVNRYAPYVNADSIAETWAKLKLTIAALQEANRG
jgi:hypothetical protein